MIVPVSLCTIPILSISLDCSIAQKTRLTALEKMEVKLSELLSSNTVTREALFILIESKEYRLGSLAAQESIQRPLQSNNEVNEESRREENPDEKQTGQYHSISLRTIGNNKNTG